MKLKYLFFSVVMAGLITACALIADILTRTFITHTHFSLDKFTFALLFTFMGIYFYNRAEEMNKED